MDVINKVDWITDLELDWLKVGATHPFSLGVFDSLDSILTTLKVKVIIEPGITEIPDSTILKKILEYWEKEAERLKRIRKDNTYSDERYQEALRNIEELNYELRADSKHFARGVHDAKEMVIRLYPDEMRQEYDGQRMDELLVSTLAHETMHSYFNRKGFGKYPYVFHVEEPLAEFGMLLWLHETDCGGRGYYQWAYDDVKNKRSCYRFGAMLMDQHLKAGLKSPERCYLERYPIRLNPNTMLSVHNGTVSLPERGEILPLVKIDGHRSFRPRWEDVYEHPPRYYYDEEADTLCLDGYWGDIRLTDAPDIVIDSRSEVSMFSPEVKHLYLGAHFCTDDIRHAYPLCLCPVDVSPMNRVFAEINNIPVYRKDNKPVLRSCGKGLYEICRDGKWGVIDENFKQVIPCKYNGVGSFGKSGLMTVKILSQKDEFLYGMVNLQGVEQIPVIYESINRNPQGTYTVTKDGEEYTIDRFGNRIDNKS